MAGTPGIMGKPLTSKKVGKLFREQSDRYSANFERAGDLIRFADGIITVKGADAKIGADVLRAATVLIHATLEDFLRYLAIRYLPEAGNDALNELGGRVTVASLAANPRRTVKQVIRDALAHIYEEKSFGQSKEIRKLMSRLVNKNILPLLERHFPLLESLIDRRHKIVHEADLTEQRTLRDIDVKTVQTWKVNVMNFVTDLGVFAIAYNDGKPTPG